MWKPGGCLECVQQDASSKCGHMDRHDIGTHAMWPRAEALGLFQEMKQEGVDPNSVTSAYLPFKRVGVLIRKSFKKKPASL